MQQAHNSSGDHATEHAADQLAQRLCRGERAAVATALNLLDDRRPAARERATQLLDALQRDGGIPLSSHLVGITGPPGAGKSSLTAALIGLWRERGLRVGVLAVDPSSPLSGGALLGDRLRMQQAGDDGVFVRSLSSRGEFGGLSAEVWPMSLVLLAACDIVLVETVGVGQREVDVAAICDTTCFVAQPGSGDSIQFLKAGILEVPHVLVVNKADMGAVARRTLSELSGALGGTCGEGGWEVRILTTSATGGSGIEELAEALREHQRWLLQSDPELRRAAAQAHWVIARLRAEFGSDGIARLGGAESLFDTLRVPRQNPFTQYRQCRLRLRAPLAGNDNPTAGPGA